MQQPNFPMTELGKFVLREIECAGRLNEPSERVIAFDNT